MLNGMVSSTEGPAEPLLSLAVMKLHPPACITHLLKSFESSLTNLKVLQKSQACDHGFGCCLKFSAATLSTLLRLVKISRFGFAPQVTITIQKAAMLSMVLSS